MRRPFVLVVDDMRDNREMYMEYLRFAGFRVAGAADGEAAIEAARTLRPSVILMDLSLPGIDGWEATRVLKADRETRHIHIVAVTGHAEPTCRARAMEVGCDLFIAKPSLPEEIAQHIVRLLDGALRGESSSG
jgi:two-component system, cell cycle response regulator DivK